MTLLELIAATLFALFVAISLFLLLARARTAGARIDAKAGFLVFDVVFGATALAMVVAGADGALWILLNVLVVRRLVETWARRRHSRPAQPRVG